LVEGEEGDGDEEEEAEWGHFYAAARWGQRALPGGNGLGAAVAEGGV
jgi:hypothetical protein